MNKITERTLLPLYLVGTLLGGASWLTAIWYDTRAHGREIEATKLELQKTQAEVSDLQKLVIEGFATMKADLRYIKENVK